MKPLTSKFGRREFLAGAATTAMAGTLGIGSLSAGQIALRAIAASKGVLLGSAVRGASIAEPDLANLVASQSSIIVPEGALKWDTLRPEPEQFDFRAGDTCLQFVEANNLLYRGHTLVWHEALPKWFEGTVTSGNVQRIMFEHISTVLRHYAGKMHSWDVVNEIVQVKDGRPDGLRATPWLRLMGPDYINAAFHMAHEADPNALLVYNEDQLEPDTFYTDAKRQQVLALLKTLRKRGTPIHALGIESHLQPDGWAASAGFKRFLQEVSDEGLAILVTEMDVSDQTLVSNFAQRDKVVADRYYDYLSFMLQFPSVKGVLTWGLSNRYSWLAAHNPRKDGLPVRPLPFDAELRPTQAWDAIRRALEEAPSREKWLPTNKQMSSSYRPHSQDPQIHKPSK